MVGKNITTVDLIHFFVGIWTIIKNYVLKTNVIRHNSAENRLRRGFTPTNAYCVAMQLSFDNTNTQWANNVRISGCIGKHAQSILDCYLRSGVHKNEQIDIFHERETIKCIFQRTRRVSAIIVGTVDHHFRIRANGFLISLMHVDYYIWRNI